MALLKDPITGGGSTLPEGTLPTEEKTAQGGATGFFNPSVSTQEDVFTAEKAQTIAENPVIEQPIINTPVIEETPELNKTTEPTPIEAPSKSTITINGTKEEKVKPILPTEPVETAQDIKAKETANASAESALNEQNKIKATDEFTKMLESGSSIEDMATFANKNIKYRDSFNSVLKSHFKNSANTKYFSKYSGMSNEQLQAQVDAGNIVPGSEQYNLLPEEQRNSFKQFQNINESVNINDKTDFTASDKVTSGTDIINLPDTIFSTNLRAKYKAMINTPEITKLVSTLSSKKAEIEKFDIEMEDQPENIRKELAGSLPGTIDAAVRDANRDSVKEKRLLLAEYNASLGEYQSLKDNAAQELDFIKYEDQQAKEKYMTALGIYEKRRGEMREDEKDEFLAKNKKIAAESQFERQKELAEFNNELRTSGNTGGNYIDNGKGDLSYVKNGKILNTLTGLGKPVGSSEDDNYTYQIKANEDGSYEVFGLPKKGQNLFHKTFSAAGEESTSWIEGTGTGSITSYGGPHDKFQGLDIDGEIGDSITLPVGGIVENMMNHPLYGKTMIIKTEDGNEIRLSHLDEFFTKVGEKVGAGSVVGTIGNTGNVLKLNGNKPTQSELKAGFGSHLDIVTTGPDGITRSSKQTEEYLNNIGIDKKEFSDILTRDQQVFFNQQQSKFKSDPQVKSFESALSSGGDLIKSLDSVSGPGDVAAIFQFMKTLDPASVVRESEFAVAGNSAGISSKPELLIKKISTGELLTNVQREEFGRLAFEFVKNKGKLYDIKYNDMERVLGNASIGGTNLPTRITDLISDFKSNDIKSISGNKTYTTSSGFKYDTTGTKNNRSNFFNN